MEWSKILRKTNRQLNSQDKNPLTDPELSKIWKVVESYKSDFEPDIEAGIERFKNRVNQNKKEQTQVITLENRRPSLGGWQRVMVMAASIAALVLVGLFGLQRWNNSDTQVYVTNTSETKEIGLPDGTNVTLNQNSWLKVAWKQNDPLRMVKFKGEAFFKVAKDPNKPFIIEGPKSKVTVLGTSFNYRDYPEELMADVEVHTGKVRFQIEDKKVEIVPKKRGQFMNNKLSVRPSNNLNAASWKNQKLTFWNTYLPEVIDDLERHFSVEFDFSKSSILDCQLTLNFTNETVEEAIETLKTALGVEINQIGANKYEAAGGNACQPIE